MEELTGDLIVRKQRFGLVTSRFNDFITQRLFSAAVDTLRRHGCDPAQIDAVWVPGAFELALATRKLAATARYDAIIALGCVIRGDTPHFDYICADVTRSLSQVSQDSGIPVIFGVLTTNTIEQAVQRAGTKSGNKGAEAALAAIEMTNLIKRIETRKEL